jgi:hypothetical protein
MAGHYDRFAVGNTAQTSKFTLKFASGHSRHTYLQQQL